MGTTVQQSNTPVQADLLDAIEKEEAEIDSAFMVDFDFYEGPIEVLYNLVKKSKISIMEVRLADITDAYLAEIEAQGYFDMDNASEFITVATMLIEIKAKSMLPDIAEIMPDKPVIDPETVLKLQMRKYELFKEASVKLKAREEVNMLFKAPSEGATDERIVVSDMNIDALLDAFAKMLNKVEIRRHVAVPRKIVKDRFTVADKIQQIRDVMRIRKRVQFTELFESDYTRGEIISTFQAMLELIRLQWVTVTQEEIFGLIDIRYKGEGIDPTRETQEENQA